ncbi:hypothetical protein ES703_76197 [subsurface metagenome]
MKLSPSGRGGGSVSSCIDRRRSGSPSPSRAMVSLSIVTTRSPSLQPAVTVRITLPLWSTEKYPTTPQQSVLVVMYIGPPPVGGGDGATTSTVQLTCTVSFILIPAAICPPKFAKNVILPS